MAFSVSSLTSYVNQLSTDLLVAAKIHSETAALATIRTGIKSAEALQLLQTNPIPQSDSCTFNASGSVTFTQRTLTVKPIKFEDSLCVKDLEAYWTQILLPGGSQYNESDIPAKIIDDIVENINKTLEIADWQGDTTSTNAYLSQFDGLIKIISNASGVVSPTASTWSVANARTIVQSVIAKIPAQLKGDPNVVIVMGYDAYEDYLNKCNIDNLFRFPAEGGYGQIQAENTIYKIKALHGLDGMAATTGGSAKGCIFAFKWSNVFLGMDKLKEENVDLMGMDQYHKNVWYNFTFKRGWQVAYPQEIVMYKNS